jgi:hypothetical protein
MMMINQTEEKHYGKVKKKEKMMAFQFATKWPFPQHKLQIEITSM